MKTLAFCTYGDGEKTTDKSAWLLRMAEYLIRHLNKKVFLLDLNLPSPCLHLAVMNGYFCSLVPEEIERGVLDYLLFFQDVGQASNELKKYVSPLWHQSTSFLMSAGAGNAPTIEYVEKLLALDYCKIFPENAPSYGTGLLFHLKHRIQAEFCPDVVLVDLPPMISNIGTAVIGAKGLVDASIMTIPRNVTEVAGLEFVIQLLRQNNPTNTVQIINRYDDKLLASTCSSLG